MADTTAYEPDRRTGPGGEDALDSTTWVVVPAYNEGQRLRRTLDELCRHSYCIVVVDDGSTDDTWNVAKRSGVWRLRHLINCGQGAAIQTGLQFALSQGARILVTFDADGQHDAAEIAQLIAPIERGEADVVLGSRFLGTTSGLPWTRWALLRLAVWFTRLVSRMNVTDTHNGLRAFSRSAARQIRITQNRMAHASEILDEIRRYGLRYVEVPVHVRYTPETLAKGQSSLNALRIAGKLLLGRLLT